MSFKPFIALFLAAFVLTGCDRVERAYSVGLKHIENAYDKFVARFLRDAPEDIDAVVFDTETEKVEAVTLISDLYSPFAVTVMPDDTLLITEKPGELYRFDPATRERVSIEGVPETKEWGQGGLMDAVPHPDFANNKWLYLSYIAVLEGDVAALRLARGKLEGNSLSDVEVLFTALPGLNSGEHFGGGIVFDDRGFVYLAGGERGERPLVQKLGNHIGKIFRLHDDGRVPADNPFSTNADARPEIYSYGHRNVQAIGIEPVSRGVWVLEHGPQGGDEINIILPGRNYGWPVISHGVEYDTEEPIGQGTEAPGMEQPIYTFTPSIAPAGIEFYTGEEFPSWRGSIIIAGLGKGGQINRVRIEGEKIVAEENMKQLDTRIRDVAQDSKGLLYVLTDDGYLIRFRNARALSAHTEPFDGSDRPVRSGTVRSAMWDIGQAPQRSRRADLAHRRPGFRNRWASLRSPCGRPVHGGNRALPADAKFRSNWFSVSGQCSK